MSDVAADLQLPPHVLRYWEKRFGQVRPLWKNNRRFYKHEDVTLLRGIQHLLYVEGYSIRGVRKILTEKGADPCARPAPLRRPKSPASSFEQFRGGLSGWPCYDDRMPHRTAAFILLFIQATHAEAAGKVNAAKLASAASRFAAIENVCPEVIPTDKVQAGKFAELFGRVGEEVEGKAAWTVRLEAEGARRVEDVRAAGAQRWCEEQRSYLRKLGDTTIFP